MDAACELVITSISLDFRADFLSTVGSHGPGGPADQGWHPQASGFAQPLLDLLPLLNQPASGRSTRAAQSHNIVRSTLKEFFDVTFLVWMAAPFGVPVVYFDRIERGRSYLRGAPVRLPR